MSVLRLTHERYAVLQKKAQQKPQTDTGRAFPASGVQTTRGKYNSRKTGGYDSAKEAKRAAELKLLEKAGTIRNLREQVRFELIPAQRDHEQKLMERECSYVADFVYESPPDPMEIVEDCKGMRTKDYIIKRKLMLHVHGIRIKET